MYRYIYVYISVKLYMFVRRFLTHSRHFASLHSNGKRHYLPATFYHTNEASALYAPSLSAQLNLNYTHTHPSLCNLVMIIIHGVCVCVWMQVCDVFLRRCIRFLLKSPLGKKMVRDQMECALRDESIYRLMPIYALLHNPNPCK